MHRRRLITGLLVALVGTLVVPAAHAGAQRQYLDAYHARVSTADLATLRARGFDVTELNVTGRYSTVELIMTRTEASLLAKRGIRARVVRHNGRTTSRRSALTATSGYTVFRPYSGPGGIEQELRSLVRRYPDIATLVRIGWTVQHTPILAVRVTTRSRREDDSKPVVLYAATQHAREWIATETDRRLLHYYLEQYATNPTVRRLVQTRELWFVPVANPDGYDYTFTPGNRLWRKNLRDNNNDGSIDPTTDGVDPNRNFATNWNYDDEGSSGDPGSETYRGTAPNSEPETRAMDGLVRQIRPVFMINYHSAAELLLYPFGFQEDTATDDNPIFLALSGTDGPDPTTLADDNAAVPGYDPDVGAELYITNGETTDHVYARYGTLAWTPELDTAQSYGAPSDVSVFEFPDDEAKVQAVFEKNVPFALNVATSAGDPGHPRASAQNPSTAYQVPATPDFVVSSFATSYGNPQVVEADARRSLGDVTLRYRINGGRWHEADAHDSRGGGRYDTQRGRFYHKVRAAVRGAHAGDDVEVTFVARHSASTPFTYHVAYDGGASVLLVAAEDYTGRSPGGPYDGPLYLGVHDAALTADGIPHAIYDIDAMGRVAPDPLGVLSHFNAVVWYTGDDLLVREPSQGPGTSSKLAHEETLAMRQYLNEGGRLLYAGRNAGYGSFNAYPYFPDNTAPVPLADDFYQYWLGAYAYQSGNDTGLVDGQQVVASGTPFSFDPFVPDAQGGLTSPSQFVLTKSILDAATYPLFASNGAAKYSNGGPSAEEPIEGSFQAYAPHQDQSYRRLGRTISVPAGTTTLDLQASYFTEQDWDYMIVEAHTVGQDDWTTLADLNGHTSTDPGQSCLAGWDSLHPQLDHYQTLDGTDPANPVCTPTGTTGSWNAMTGDSGGWVPLSFDLSAWAGKDVEVSISYVTDWSTGVTGVRIDDVGLMTDGVRTPLTGFETDLGGFTVLGAPPGSAANRKDWRRIGALDLAGAAVVTGDTVMLGFGLEQLTDADRNAVLGQAMSYLLRP
jgi:hypothetical protein